jgi:exodeoxyribonuclease VII large subunit
MRWALDSRKKRLAALETQVRQHDVRLRFAAARARMERAEKALVSCVEMRIGAAHRQLEPLVAHLTQLSPQRILDRGYAIVQNGAGAIVKDAADAAPGSGVRIRVARARLAATVVSAEPRS